MHFLTIARRDYVTHNRIAAESGGLTGGCEPRAELDADRPQARHSAWNAPAVGGAPTANSVYMKEPWCDCVRITKPQPQAIYLNLAVQ